MAPLISLQPFSEEDLVQAAKIHRLSFFNAWSQESLQSTLAIPHTFGWSAIDKTSSTLAGFLIIRQLQEEAEIMTLAVHLQRRRHKIASLLLAAMDETLKERNIERVFLEVQMDNYAALNLYEYAGYKKIGERPHYYPTPKGRAISAYVFAKEY